MIRLTDVVHRRLREIVHSGDTAIDATAGNGYDTLMLSELVGASGQVFAIDIQADAVAMTRKRLAESGFSNAIVMLGNHADLPDLVPTEYRGCIAAAVFNLGYLPRGDKNIITRGETTIRAIHSAFGFLRPEGVVSIMCYIGHPGGQDEASRVEELLQQLSTDEWRVETYTAEGRLNAPQLHLVTRSN